MQATSRDLALQDLIVRELATHALAPESRPPRLGPRHTPRQAPANFIQPAARSNFPSGLSKCEQARPRQVVATLSRTHARTSPHSRAGPRAASRITHSSLRRGGGTCLLHAVRLRPWIFILYCPRSRLRPLFPRKSSSRAFSLPRLWRRQATCKPLAMQITSQG
ncbi:hypothetical protein L226DRAFT_530708 [Lentinus tigrinus ALCF2SS1-7]|uniref:uncharacterized protein n=1 Tax=Lentinus tigrinus ALCF2SS1-7 TaxID=1328758 RepID=UPI001165FBFE|nr:hypothetical protein L226DRAFT_530708 [Lentinus tigrinus ALCF2SS1-7]